MDSQLEIEIAGVSDHLTTRPVGRLGIGRTIPSSKLGVLRDPFLPRVKQVIRLLECYLVRLN